MIVPCSFWSEKSFLIGQCPDAIVTENMTHTAKDTSNIVISFRCKIPRKKHDLIFNINICMCVNIYVSLVMEFLKWWVKSRTLTHVTNYEFKFFFIGHIK